MLLSKTNKLKSRLSLKPIRTAGSEAQRKSPLRITVHGQREKSPIVELGLFILNQNGLKTRTKPGNKISGHGRKFKNDEQRNASIGKSRSAQQK